MDYMLRLSLSHVIHQGVGGEYLYHGRITHLMCWPFIDQLDAHTSNQVIVDYSLLFCHKHINIIDVE